MVAEGWQDCKVGDIAASTRNALVGGPFGSNLVSADYVPNGVPVIRGQNMGLGRWVGGDFVFVTSEKAASLVANIARPGDLVFTQRGTLGQVAIVPDNGFEQYLLSQSQMKLTVDPASANVQFLYYVFISSQQQEYILRNAIQTGVPHTNLGILRNTPISLPSLPEQRAIAHVLGTLDDKIELNRRMNETLEAMACTIFKSWFVDFDPVRAKAAGRQPAGMDAETAALFPDAFEDSALGKMPKGWKVIELGEIVDVIDCLHSKKPERQETGKPLLQLSNIRDDGLLDMADTYFINEDDYRFWISRIEASPGDCVITNVGRVGAVAQVPTGVKAALGRNMTALRCKPSYNFPTFIIESLLSESMKQEMSLKIDTGTILDALNVRNIPKLRCVLAPPILINQFEQLCRPLRAHMEHNLAESRSLTALRDALLPKLMSGEVRVAPQDAERFIEEQSRAV